MSRRAAKPKQARRTVLPLGRMVHLLYRIFEELQADARSDVFEIEDLSPVASLAGAVYLRTELAPQKPAVRVGDAGDPRLLERREGLCNVADDPPCLARGPTMQR